MGELLVEHPYIDIDIITNIQIMSLIHNNNISLCSKLSCMNMTFLFYSNSNSAAVGKR